MSKSLQRTIDFYSGTTFHIDYLSLAVVVAAIILAVCLIARRR